MEELSIANERLKTACNNRERDFNALIKKLDDKENSLKERLDELTKKRLNPDHVNFEVADGDLVEVNAGGKIVAAKRSTLTQFEGTKFEALFSGHWDKKLQRDGNGRIFWTSILLAFRRLWIISVRWQFRQWTTLLVIRVLTMSTSTL